MKNISKRIYQVGERVLQKDVIYQEVLADGSKTNHFIPPPQNGYLPPTQNRAAVWLRRSYRFLQRGIS
ncbi:hypothetical protein GCM10007939_20210 [Amylibacter marinus]|uniref:Uncharacterized protein n=1 Tax=Amylibacter marinus TaxID=1475483 RepID=A0ABQ5VWB9_9RHOB|nr:hypothetical protein [Amylibacter marinus]GLQ35738.1 hypothetical protein GCM10007939_20210 [Amylibacter marinus]